MVFNRMKQNSLEAQKFLTESPFGHCYSVSGCESPKQAIISAFLAEK